MDGNVPNSYIVQNNNQRTLLVELSLAQCSSFPVGLLESLRWFVTQFGFLSLFIMVVCMAFVSLLLFQTSVWSHASASSISFTNSYATVLPSSQIVFVLSGLSSTACLFSLPVIDFIWMVKFLPSFFVFPAFLGHCNNFFMLSCALFCVRVPFDFFARAETAVRQF